MKPGEDRATEVALRQLAQKADGIAAVGAHVGEPILALLRAGDHGDDIADAMTHAVRCADCRARLFAGEVGSRAVVVIAIEAPKARADVLARAAEKAQALLVDRGHGRWTAVVDAERADMLRAELEGEQSVVSRLVVSTPLAVPREESTSGRRPMPSMFEMAPEERGTEAAEVHAWAEMRRQPKKKIAGGASPGWALFAVAAIGGAMAIAYFLATR